MVNWERVGKFTYLRSMITGTNEKNIQLKKRIKIGSRYHAFLNSILM